MPTSMPPQLQQLLQLLTQQRGPKSIPIEGSSAEQILPAIPGVQQVKPGPIAPMPRPRPQMPNAPAMAPQAAPQIQPPQGGGGRGALAEFFNIDPRIGQMLESAMGGAASADPTRPFLTTMGQGYVGGRQSRQAREDRKRAELVAQTDAARERRGEGRDERRLALDERKSRYGTLKTAAEIEKILTDTQAAKREAKSLGLTANEVIQIANATNKYIQGEIQRRGGEYRLDKDDRVEIDESAQEYRDDLTRRAQEAATGQKAGGEAEGAGTMEDPFRLPSGGEQAAYEALPSGAIFINPKDGTILRKP